MAAIEDCRSVPGVGRLRIGERTGAAEGEVRQVDTVPDRQDGGQAPVPLFRR